MGIELKFIRWEKKNIFELGDKRSSEFENKLFEMI